MIKPDRKPYVPECRNVFGPGVEIWKAVERNNDAPTNHEALLDDKPRRRRISAVLRANARQAATND